MNKEIENYINSKVLPLYEKNDESHSLSHINCVINYSLQLGKKYNLNEDMLYTISAYHDVGVFKDRSVHEIISAEYFYKDKFWKNKFSEEERKIIYEAILDHRASSKRNPRSIYGKIVATADRQFDCFEDAVKRTYGYLVSKNKEKSINEIYELIYRDFNNRYGNEGYVKVYVNKEEFEKQLKPIKELLLDKNKFIEKVKMILNNGRLNYGK